MIFIHIGYPKAASTTLQKQLFDKHPEINNFGLYPTGNLGKDSKEINYDCIYLKNKNLRKFYRNLTRLNGVEYFYSNNLQLYTKSIEPLIKQDCINLFSNERLTSVFYAYNDLKGKADRLKKIFSQAKIIIILRNQINISISRYRDWPFDPREVRIGKPVYLNKWIKIAIEDQYAGYMSTLKYYEIANIYSVLFGKKNVGLFLFEDLVYQPEIFPNKLSIFMGIDSETTMDLLKNKHENQSVSHRYNLYRMLNRKTILPNINSSKLPLPVPLKQKILEFLKQGNKKNYKISSAMKIKLREYFAASNNNLAKEYNLNLSRYDYPM